ncbi:hypothetical protein [Oenococcus oeni]|uniref:Uncharacterized protein n=1 Tax=Oenococcus oeni AWRIB429 TaxID=655225 RepID=D3L6T2_OENOE|nr:hypothetical protein [Oenococcus oeni]EFD89414.1 hypothetical protein AWRIB429_0062 [Oenococcus oeni AWRIB429]KEP88540.1 hypothetical protein X279_00800 [Oenococcus oeni IOEB_0501]KZD13051.1 hypothetical protein AC229_0672 [Oenococcus oeni]MDQ8695892.1 hypothetical protein [Oenococcus oeni]MDQ8718201.1 hypothetical protein [Oenococcus oeni]
MIHRANGVEDKWVGSTQHFSAAQIKDATNFQEQYFDSRLIFLGNIGKSK